MARVLIVDDDADLLAGMEAALLQAGHEVLVAPDGEEAIFTANALLPDVVVTDVVMPKKDGYELLTELRAAKDTSLIPVVLLSQISSKDARLAAFRLGCDDFLPKPFDFEELIIRVERAFRNRQRSSYQTSAIPPGTKLHGSLEDLSLHSLLTLFDLEKKTGVLEVRDSMGKLEIHLRDGAVVKAVDAENVSRGTIDVICDALRMKNGNFNMKPRPIHGVDSVRLSSAELVLEAMRRNDEEDAAS